MIADRKDREEKMGMMDPRGARGKASVYYRYVGSLTTPPCSEGVIWTIIKRVRPVSFIRLHASPCIKQNYQQVTTISKIFHFRTISHMMTHNLQLSNKRIHFWNLAVGMELPVSSFPHF